MPDLVPASFSVDHLGIYPGLILAENDRPDQGDHVSPLFTFDVAQQIATDWVAFEGMPDEPPAQALYDADADAFRLFEPATREWHELEGEHFGPQTLYAMGRDLWTWQRTSPFDSDEPAGN